MKNYVMLSLLLINFLSGIESNSLGKSLKVFVIPGQNDQGLEEGYVNEKTGIFHDKIHRIETPTNSQSIDFGQSNCMQKLENSLQDNKDQFIIYANSQGTATALNFFSKNQKLAAKCKGMVLESVLASGNSAIYHTITSTILGIPKLKWVPFLYHMAPYFAKWMVFPSYSPGGDQPIKLIANLDIDGPIIIAHSEKDPQLSYNDARAIYYALRKKNKTAYLISKKEIGHINILPSDYSVKNILSCHGIIPEERATSKDKLDISKYQPDLGGHKSAYDELINREEMIVKYGPLPLCLTTIGVSLIGFAAIIKLFFSKKLRIA